MGDPEQVASVFPAHLASMLTSEVVECYRCKKAYPKGWVGGFIHVIGDTPETRNLVCGKCLQQEENVKAEIETQRLRRERIATIEGQLELRIPPLYHNADYLDFSVKRQLCDWYSVKTGLLFLHGGCGTGKTRALWATFRRGYADSVSCSIYGVVDVVRKMQALTGENVALADEHMRTACRYDGILGLDDLGATKMTEFATGIVEELIDKRVAWQKPTIVTSNLDLEGVRVQLGDRIASRIAGETRIHMTGPDRRVEGAKGGAR